MMDFLEAPCFPTHLAQQITRSLGFLTEVVQLASGAEQRNAVWRAPLHRYDLSASAQTFADLQSLEAFFHTVKGRWLPFRFKDPLDYQSAEEGCLITATDQVVGRGDGEQRIFQLIKTTTVDTLTQVRVIQKPVLDSVMIAINGIETNEVEIDFSTGVITFLEPPPLDTLITAGFVFDIPCRFDSDQCVMSLQPPALGSTSLSLIEVRLPFFVVNRRG